MADLNHSTLTDDKLHQPKGASTASLNQVLTSNGDGTTRFADLPEELFTVLDDISSESVVSQTLDTAGTELQVAFGAAATSPNGSVSIATDGTITFLEDGVYYVNVRALAGRSVSTSTSTLGFSGRANGTQVGSTVPITLDNAADGFNISVADTSVVEVTAGTTYSYHMRLFDDGGGDNGIFFVDYATAGWNNTPSARISIRKIGLA
ncbi:hypothetical protein PODOV005v1_10035 [Vibrio phage PS32B.2]|nr:hypothetical protein PODOV005v1_10035 [Vibrio phage PS32B.2]QZI86337.1 hypothetical protein PODOV028v1_10046 [Vibrio phage PS32B.3]QZI86360.1 hypothetical protein PODOV029v1_10007 [Vibrio phage PS35B.1]QZI86417.1 hypothetical protein PODOV027v1_10008 [Vibrio phage PS35B.3]QZI92226.1 hypothetical protein PODOV026v1_p0053 [Vibrio phage PS32B.1]QZI92269.1 hypothetical protein PODOV004v1_p0034 [Vibrio phage PS32B.11]QZI92350.1 hypothetical protein PODOV025v1_p0053 [Vibrio phage PS32B.6]